MPWVVAGLLGGATLLSGKKQSDNIKNATKTGDAFLREGRDIALNESGLRGYASTGLGANDRQAALLGLGGDPVAAQQGFDNYLDSAGYKFQLKSGNDAITSSAAARGLLKGGATDKARIKFGQGLGASYFDSYLDKIGGVANRGLNAAGNIASVASGVGAQRANNFTDGYGEAAGVYGGAQRSALDIFGSAAGDAAGRRAA